jgi:hypothetical protein
MGWGLVGGSQVTGEGATEADMGTLALSSVSLLPSDHEGNRYPLPCIPAMYSAISGPNQQGQGLGTEPLKAGAKIKLSPFYIDYFRYSVTASDA